VVREVLENTIENLITNFKPEILQAFFYLKAKDKWEEYTERLSQYEDDEDELFGEILKVGNLRLSDNSLVGVYTIATQKELTERSSKKRQFELGRKILKDQPDAGFFVFHDSEGNFRFSFIYPIYYGTKRKYSPYKRYTHYVSPKLTNKTFKLALRDAEFSSLEKIIEAFSIEKVTEEFFEAYKYALREVIIKSLSKYDAPYEKKHSFAQQLLSRILFIYFLQKKDGLNGKIDSILSQESK